jgi:D-xylose 1-dehydrogenase (NADP+, D-xylono-1,5-lactone-forming)
MLRWGILGTGTVASRAVAPALRACGHDLAVVGSRSLTRARTFAATQGVRRARASYGEVVTASDVDAVYIALPNDLHERWTLAAIDAGKHVLCEKPLALNAESAARMATAARQSGCLLMEAVMTRFHPRTSALLELVRGGGVGAVRLIHTAFTFPMRMADSYRARLERGGGALLDVGPYTAAVIRWLAGEEPDVVRAEQRRWATGIDCTVAALLGFSSGMLATMQVSFDGAEHQQLEIIGTEATLRVPRPFTAWRDEPATILRGPETLGEWRADPYEQMVRAFSDGVYSGTSVALPVTDSVKTAHLLDWIRAAAEGYQ